MLHRQLSSFSTASSSSTLIRKCLRRSTAGSNNNSLTPFSTSSLSLQQTRGMSSCSSSNNNNYGDDINAIRQSLERLVDDHKSLRADVNECATNSQLSKLKKEIDYLLCENKQQNDSLHILHVLLLTWIFIIWVTRSR